jgi:ABC-type antimicrobial peptide transport system permease subunit
MIPMWMDSWSNGPGMDSHFFEKWRITPALRPLKEEVIGIAGAMAFVLGIIGIYGVISYAVLQRTREIVIRLALGEPKGRLGWMFVRSALALTGIGVAIGLAAAAGLMQLMKSLLFGVSPLDPFTYVSVLIILAVFAVLASYLPARRAASVDPVEALRAE